MERIDSLPLFLENCWRLLLNGAVKRNDPLRTPVIGTFDGHQAYLRTMILRKTDVQNRTLLFFSDFRAAKVTHLQQFTQLSCLFYHPRRQFQIRAKGAAKLHHKDSVAQAQWSNIPIIGRKNYASPLAPGTKMEFCTDGIPDFWQEDMDLSETEYAFDNFLVVTCEIEMLDCLYLHPEGHQRARFDWQHGNWESSWLIP